MSEIKLGLPAKGLIVSCYLEGLRGAELQFIACVSVIDGVVALRVESTANIAFAKSITTLPIIGLIKRQQENGAYITANLTDLKAVEQAGADFVAIDSRICNKQLGKLYNAATKPIMADIQYLSEAVNAIKLGATIIATTFVPKAFDLAGQIKSIFPEYRVNLEGGIETPAEIKQAFKQGIDYVTIGKMINDPPTIIKYFLDGNIAWL